MRMHEECEPKSEVSWHEGSPHSDPRAPQSRFVSQASGPCTAGPSNKEVGCNKHRNKVPHSMTLRRAAVATAAVAMAGTK